MKKTLLMKTMLLLCALVVGSMNGWAVDTENISANQFGFSSNTNLSGANATLNATNFSLTFAKNDASNVPAYNKTSEEFRLYKSPSSGKQGNSITIAATTIGVTFTKIEFTFSNLPTNYSFSEGSYNKSSMEWTGTSTSSLTLTNTDLSGQLKIKSMKIYYVTAAVPEHTATFNINGAESSDDYKEGEDIIFPANPSISGLIFMGWTTTPIVGTQDVAPAVLVSSATMSDSDVSFYAVFAKETYEEGEADLTITPSTENFPTSYGDANTFTEYTLEGKKFKIQQAYINSGKLQWRAAGNSNGTGTMYNTETLNKIQSIVLAYNGDSNKNFTVEVGDEENPSGGTSVDASTVGNVSTFDCSSYNKDYFVLTNGSGAGYLASIKITYLGQVLVYKAYCTTVSSIPVSISDAGLATFASDVALDFTDVTGVEAYIAKENDVVITLTKVNKVPAGTGVLLRSTIGAVAEDVPVAATTDDVTGNIFVRGNDAAVATSADGKYNWILSKKGEVIGFYHANGNNVAKNRAYLQTVAAEARINLNFDDEDATAIEAIKTQNVENGQYFNLAGQRVAQPTKGLYIVNGKKVIIK